MVCELAALAVDPPFSHLEALELARDAGPILAFVHAQIMSRMGSAIAQTEVQELDEVGEDWSPNLSTDSTSQQDATS